MASSVLAGLVEYELRRESSKRSTILVVILMVLPFIAALAVKSMGGVEAPGDASRLWASIMGLDPEAAIQSPQVAAIGGASLISWSWLIAALYGGDLLASDVSEGAASYIIARGVRRSEYVLGKFAAVTATLIFVFIVAGVSVYGAAWVLAGRQEGLAEAVGYSVIVALGVMPTLLVSALAGLASGKPVIGMIAGILAMFASAIIRGLAVVAYSFSGEPVRAVEAMYLVGAALPFSSGSDLASIVYSALNDVTVTIPVAVQQGSTVMVTVRPGDYLLETAVGVAAWTVALLALLWWMFSRRDL